MPAPWTAHRQVVAFCGDGGLSMLMGDLITAVTHDLPVKLVVFDNGRLGMVKLEMEQVGLPEFGTVLHNPDFAEVAESVGMPGRPGGAARRRGRSRGRGVRPRRSGAARRAHQPRRDRRTAHADASSRAGASRSPRPGSSSTVPSDCGYRARRPMSLAPIVRTPGRGSFAARTIAVATSSARVGRKPPSTGPSVRITTSPARSAGAGLLAATVEDGGSEGRRRGDPGVSHVALGLTLHAVVEDAGAGVRPVAVTCRKVVAPARFAACASATTASWSTATEGVLAARLPDRGAQRAEDVVDRWQVTRRSEARAAVAPASGRARRPPAGPR